MMVVSETIYHNPTIAFGALQRCGSGVFGRRPLLSSPPLERRFIAFPSAKGIVARRRPTLEVAYSCSSNKLL